MFAIAGGLILAVLFFMLLPLMLTKRFLAAVAVLIASSVLLAFIAVAPTDFAVLAIMVPLGVGVLVQAAYVARRDDVSLWHALRRLSVRTPSAAPPRTQGIVPKSWRD